MDNQKMSNIFAAIPKDLSTEQYDNIVESENVKIERIISKGHSLPESGWYEQASSEWVMVLKGGATIAFEDESSVTLKAGDYFEIVPFRKHKVTWSDPDVETVWLAVHY
ncbi:MAG: cupin 2 domain-containing protein [Psychromonas sp.]|jgi:cupin 2 domain-containing protein|uniref:cupin domain-containing protein n=1 Tax=Psychromonas sp. TaxID=1884585 RepID=UPI0039E2AC92